MSTPRARVGAHQSQSSVSIDLMGNAASTLRRGAIPWVVGIALFMHARRVAARTTAVQPLLTYLSTVIPGNSVTRAFVNNVLGAYVIYKLLSLLKSLRHLQRMGIIELKNSIGGWVFSLGKDMPGVRDKLASEKAKLRTDIRKQLKSHVEGIARLHSLPEQGRADDAIFAELQQWCTREEPRWQSGRVSGAVYSGDPAHTAVLNKAYQMFSLTNPLHADLWPSVAKMEAEIVSMTASMLNGGDASVCGLLTSGGTESIFMSCKAHRDWARSEKGITDPEIIVPRTAHAAFDKACDVMGIRLVKIDTDPTTQMVDVAAMRRAVTSDTIMIVGSAPQYPHGTIDPIERLAEIAHKNNIGLHVDCCLGGFILPFARQLGYDIPAFDFGVRGVTGMSVDTHKYGYAVKGTSVVLFRNADIRRHGYFAYPNWPGGLYATPTMGGSRPGGLSVATWVSIVRLGREGFLRNTRAIMDTAHAMRKGVAAIRGLKLVGDQRAMIVAFGSDVLNVYTVSDRMAHRGWSLNALQSPSAVHICITLRHVGREQEFLHELAEVVDEVSKDKSGAVGGTAPIYGMASSLPAGPIEEMLATYIDVVYEV